VFYALIGVVSGQAIVQAVVSIKNKRKFINLDESDSFPTDVSKCLQLYPCPPGVTGCYSFPIGGNENYAFVYWVLPLFTQTM